MTNTAEYVACSLTSVFFTSARYPGSFGAEVDATAALKGDQAPTH
jgi:hypothetical protein